MKKNMTICAGIAVTTLAMASVANAGVFAYNGFPNSNGLTLVSDAGVSNNALQLNKAVGSSRGAAWYTQSKMDVATGFSTSFQFRVTDRLLSGADGFAFVIQNTSPTAIGADGGGIGYGTNPVFGHQPGIANSVAVEFDLFNNTGGWSDTAWARNVSVQSRGQLENSPDAAYSYGAAALSDVGDGALHDVTIVYTPGIMTVLVDGAATLTAAIDLGILNLDAGQAWVGFTAATGGAIAAETHQIETWSFNSVPTPGAASLACVGGLLMARRRRA